MPIRSLLPRRTGARLLHRLCLLLALLSATDAAAYAQGAPTTSLGDGELPKAGSVDPWRHPIQIIHTALDAGPVDVYMDGLRLLDDFDYLQATPFVPLPAGIHTIDLVAGDAEDNAHPSGRARRRSNERSTRP